MTRSKLVSVAWVAGIAFFGLLGLWAFLSPRSFYDALATYPPFNAHFLRDGGAFNLGIAASLAAATRICDGLSIALITAAVGALWHAVSHIVDADLGGRATDPWSLSLFALVLTAGAVIRLKEVRR